MGEREGEKEVLEKQRSDNVANFTLFSTLLFLFNFVCMWAELGIENEDWSAKGTNIISLIYLALNLKLNSQDEVHLKHLSPNYSVSPSISLDGCNLLARCGLAFFFLPESKWLLISCGALRLNWISRLGRWTTHTNRQMLLNTLESNTQNWSSLRWMSWFQWNESRWDETRRKEERREERRRLCRVRLDSSKV